MSLCFFPDKEHALWEEGKAEKAGGRQTVRLSLVQKAATAWEAPLTWGLTLYKGALIRKLFFLIYFYY